MARLVNPSFVRVVAPNQGALLDQVKVGAWAFGTTPNSHPNDPIAVESVTPQNAAGDTCEVPLATLLPRLADGVEYDLWVQGVNEGITGTWVKVSDTIVAAAIPTITSADLH